MKKRIILTLRIKKAWFDKIKSGEKKIEYREVKPFYQSRIEGKGVTHCRLIAGYSRGASEITLPIKSIRIKNTKEQNKPHYCINLKTK